ncbi:hypothetical protein QNI16_27795 [Cytophagaceae bacterium YF14B1]|uniref:YD repeat-containing protein n=1 Tax=Xanthocytophaga flava TaxID=3048013 RepID=A0AAE3QRW1_9BACT|nr:hypothetical protein [Xanthocytophaga flavus]MDJ1484332.1 hypothetical protein [Xanthocytophaga flavus]
MIKRLLALVFIGALLITSCKSDSDETPTPEKTCKVTQSKTITIPPNGNGIIDTTTTTYEYNSQGYPTRQTSISSSYAPITSTLTYNSEGLLTEEVNTGGSSSDSYRQVNTYTYTGGKLSREIIKYTSNTSNYVYDFYFNPDGRLSYRAFNGTSQDINSIDSVLYGYTNGKLTSIRERSDRNGNTTNHLYTITTNEKGFITSRTEGSNKQLYQYNSYGEIVRLDMYNGEQLYSYQIYEYDDKKRIDDIINPLFKAQTSMYQEGILVHNMTKFVSYNVIPNQPDSVFYTNTFEYEYGTHGYPTKVVNKRSWNGEPTTFITTYTFDCQ